MRTAKFTEIVPNYRKNVLEISLQEGKKTSRHELPFHVFSPHKIDAQHRLARIEIESKLDDQSAILEFSNGKIADFPADLVLYHCDPSYDWSPLNQLKRAIQGKAEASRLSVRVLADALATSPSQVVRLFKENNGSRQLSQLFRIAELTGHQVEFRLKKRTLSRGSAS